MRTVIRVLVEYDTGETQIIGPLTGNPMKFPITNEVKPITPKVEPKKVEPKKVKKMPYDPRFPMKPRTGRKVVIDGKEYISVQQAARYLKMNPSVVTRRCAAEHIRNWEYL